MPPASRPLRIKAGGGLNALITDAHGAPLRLGHPSDDPAGVIDDGRPTGVGGHQHGTAQFQRPHSADHEMLIERSTISKPRQIADVDQRSGHALAVNKEFCHFIAKHVFVTNAHGVSMLVVNEGIDGVRT